MGHVYDACIEQVASFSLLLLRPWSHANVFTPEQTYSASALLMETMHTCPFSFPSPAKKFT